ncbi:MAG: xanthine dehydrogenase family protein subunit M [Tepidamorphaceae bacterium]
MKPAPFEYLRATSVSEALEFLQHDDAKIIAGGQSLVPMMNFRLTQPERLVDINAIAELTEISEDGADIVIGSLVRHAEAMRSPLLARRLPVIAEAMRHVAHLAIRNRGTVGGSLVHADPSAEWPLLVALLNGEIIVEGPEEWRYLAAEEFFIAPLVTDIGEDEILTAVRFPEPPSGAGMAFDEVARRAGDFAMAASGALVQVEGGVIRDLRVALGGVGDGPVRATALEEELTGKPVDAVSVADIAELACEGLEPMTDLHASAEYRLHLVPVLVGRVLETALARAAGGKA